MKKVELLYLSQEDIMSLNIGWKEIIARTELACVEQANGTVECPPKRGVHTRENAFIHEMPVWLKKMDACGIKWVSGYPENYKYDLPQVLGVQIMNDPNNGLPTCVMDCRWITAVRTAAASAITMRHCAKKDTETVSIIGAGVQGRMHLLAFSQVLPNLKKCRIFDIKDAAVQAYVKEMSEKTGCEIIPCKSVEEAVQNTDIIMTCTQKLSHPIIPADALKPGMTGAGTEAARAWPESILHGVDKVITDDLDQTMSYTSGGAFAGGLPEFYCQLGDLIDGKKPGRENGSERILAFNIGFAAEDISLGKYIYECALERGVGTRMPLMESEF